MASELGESERPGENQSINSEQVKDSVELLATTNAPADIVTEGDDAENVDFQETKEINISTVPPDSPTENSLLLSSSVDNSMASNAVVVSTWSEVDDQQNTNISANNRCEFVWSETEEDAAVVNKVSSKNNGKGGNNNEEEDIITELRDKTVEELPSDCVQNEKTSQTQCEEIVPKDVENEMDCVGETKQSKDEKAGGGEKGEDEVEEGEEGRGGGEDGEDGEEVTVVRQRRSRLECRECGKRFTRRETYNLHRHFHMHQDEQASLTCKECGLTFQHRSSLIKHRNEHKAKNVPPLPTSERKQQNKECREDSDLQCDRCGGTFPTLIKLKLHACERSLEKLYRCPLCRKEFQYRVSINTHMQSHSFDSPFRCLECNKGFQCAATLHIHQRSHAALKPFECPDCGMVFRYRSIMEDHRRKHTEERPYQCSICGKSFKYGSLLNQHQYLHTGQKPYQCPDCGKKFAFAQNMRAHCRQHKKQPFICSQCPLTFPDSASLEMHIPSHKKPLGKTTGATGKENTNYGVEKRRDFKCPLCPEIFHKPVDLRTHMLIHEAEFERMTNAKSSDQTYFCPRCPLRFSNEAALQSHVLTHQPTSVPIKREVRDLNVVRADGIENVSVGGEWVDHSEKKPLKCRECGKCFRHRSVLQLHMRIHSKDRPYQCNVCFKTFRFSSYLQQHLIIHTGKKPYKCPDCGKGFAFLQNMRTHQRLHQQKPFRCTQCCKGYSDENQLQRHMLSHTGDKPYKCHLCDKSFGLAYLLRDHLNTHTGERPHRCQECNKSFPWLSSLVVHQKIHERKRLGFPSQRGRPRGGRGRSAAEGQHRSNLPRILQHWQPDGQTKLIQHHQSSGWANVSALTPPAALVRLPERHPSQEQQHSFWLISSTSTSQPVPQNRIHHELPKSSNSMDGAPVFGGRIPLSESMAQGSPIKLRDGGEHNGSALPQNTNPELAPPSPKDDSKVRDTKTLTDTAQTISSSDKCSNSREQQQERQSPNMDNQTRVPLESAHALKNQESNLLGLKTPPGITKSLSLPEKAGKGSEQQQLQLQLIQQLPQQLQRHQIPQHLQLLQQPQQIKLLRLQQPQPMQNLQQPEQLQKQQQATLQQQNQLPPAWVSAGSSTQMGPIAIQYRAAHFPRGDTNTMWGFRAPPVGSQALITGQVQQGNAQGQQQLPVTSGSQILINQNRPFISPAIPSLPPFPLPAPLPIHSVAVGQLTGPSPQNLFFSPRGLVGDRMHLTQNVPLPQLARQTEPHKLGNRMPLSSDRLLQCMICGCTLPRELDLQVHYLQHAQGEI